MWLYGSRKWVRSSVLRAFSASNACFALSRKPPKLQQQQAQPLLPKWDRYRALLPL